MTDITGTLLTHRARLNEIATVFARHGLASWAARGAAVVPREELEGTDGQRLRGALTDLGTTFVKFGQMLSLRPDVIGEDMANELSSLQATVPADPARGRATHRRDAARCVAGVDPSSPVQ
jgi:ubiquinone biosynthesis protein